MKFVGEMDVSVRSVSKVSRYVKKWINSPEKDNLNFTQSRHSEPGR